MKKGIIYFFLLFVAMISSCKDELVLITKIDSIAVSDVKINSATVIVGMENVSSASSNGVIYGTDSTNLEMKSLFTEGKNEALINLTGLTQNTVYYVKAFSFCDGVTNYSKTISFWTYDFSDYDGNLYHSVTIGDQTWMAENLKVTHYRNGEKIETWQNNFDWKNSKTGICCKYNFSDSLAMIYGFLYDHLVISDDRNIAPAGWHIPSMDEWSPLFDLKAEDLMATNCWTDELKPTNSTKFGALPAGYFYVSDWPSDKGYNFYSVGSCCDFASSTFTDDGYTRWWVHPSIDGRNNHLGQSWSSCETKSNYKSSRAVSVRLIKDKN